MKNINKGFTLVELLIVIVLLGAIALAVIAAINPIEQANRARDTRFKTDGATLVSAIDRYFATKSEFPWVTNATVTSNDSSFGYITASSVGVGLCADAGCSTDGELITSLELKPEFKNRDFVKSGNGSDNAKKLFVGKDAGSAAGVSTCFIPASKSNREKAVAEAQVYQLDTANGTRSLSNACDAVDVDWEANGCYICVPE